MRVEKRLPWSDTHVIRLGHPKTVAEIIYEARCSYAHLIVPVPPVRPGYRVSAGMAPLLVGRQRRDLRLMFPGCSDRDERRFFRLPDYDRQHTAHVEARHA